MPNHVVIIGGGLVGSLNACFFAKRGWTVDVYEAREDIRTQAIVKGRSINLALSTRGRQALAAVDLDKYIVEQGVPMYARLVHDNQGKIVSRQPYGKVGQHIVSINRRHLNEVLISQAESCPSVTFHFEHRLTSLDRETGTMHFSTDAADEDIVVRSGVFGATLVCACDGAYSAMRKCIMNIPRFDYSHEYIQHGYLELNIEPTEGAGYAMEPNVFHLWPRGEYTMIALANKDCTFTVTLFAPFRVFDEQLSTDALVEKFFEENFPDALALIGRDCVIARFRETKAQALVSLKCEPHHLLKNILLMGDAAHAMGMNCGFEDCYLLNTLLDEYENVETALEMYSKIRCKDTHAINDLAMYNYKELRDLVNKRSYKLRKWLDSVLYRIVPSIWMPLYSMVTFSTMPYHEVVVARQWQDQIIDRVMWGTLYSALVIGAAFGVKRFYA